jgi:RepB DNA-primase from phage plasmid
VYQQLARPDPLFRHIFGNLEGFVVTFTGEQARFRRPDARPNELRDTRQLSWAYPAEIEKAAEYLLAEAERGRDTYFGVHLFRKAGNRLSANAVPTVQCLWLDEDEGHFPGIGPEPTATICSSARRRHLYWQLTHPVDIEWATSLNRRLAVWAGGDAGKAGKASVLRVPGTANYKRHPQVDLVAGELTGSGPWEPDVIDQAVPEISEPSPPSRTEPYTGPEADLEPYLAGGEILSELIDGLGAKYAIVCPWIHEHTGGDRTGTRVGQRVNGGLWFHCDHEHCQGRGWAEFKTALRSETVRIIRPTKTPKTHERTVRIHRG